MNPHICTMLGFEPCPARIAWGDGPGWLLAYLLVIAVGFVYVAIAEKRP